MPLVPFVICLMAGIVLQEQVNLSWPLFPLLVAMIVIALLLWKQSLLQSLAIAVCSVLLGMMLMQRQESYLQVIWPEGEVVYEAVVLSDPVEKPKTMAVDVLLVANQRKLKCYLYKDDRSRRLRVGDGLHIQSQIKVNSDWRRGAFDYRRYLEIHGFTGTTFVSSWKWYKTRVSLESLSIFERTRLAFLRQRAYLLQRLSEQGMAQDQYAIVAAMSLGDKSQLTEELKDVYSRTGASHVLALSGLHLGIIYSLLSMLVVGRRWRAVSQVVVISCIWAYVFLVGMSVSIVRSALMLSIYALLSLGHREKMSVNTLAFTAIVLLSVNPLSLFDVGFQLSFMAVLSILVLGPLFMGIFSEVYLQEHRIFKWLWGMAAVSSAAQLGVAPLIAYYFGRFSSYFLLTNLIVMPAATLILGLSLAVILFPSLAFLLNSVVGWQNTLLKMVAAIPGATIENLHPSVLQVVMVYVITCSLTILAHRLGWLRPSGGSGYRSPRTQHGS